MDDVFADIFVQYEKLTREQDLKGKVCELYHSSQDPPGPAVDNWCQAIVYHGRPCIIEFYVCKDCVEALLGHEWNLYICLGCMRTAWSSRARRMQMANLTGKVRDDIQSKVIYFKRCSHCYSQIERFIDNQHKIDMENSKK